MTSIYTKHEKEIAQGMEEQVKTMRQSLSQHNQTNQTNKKDLPPPPTASLKKRKKGGKSKRTNARTPLYSNQRKMKQAGGRSK